MDCTIEQVLHFVTYHICIKNMLYMFHGDPCGTFRDKQLAQKQLHANHINCTHRIRLYVLRLRDYPFNPMT